MDRGRYEHCRPGHFELGEHASARPDNRHAGARGCLCAFHRSRPAEQAIHHDALVTPPRLARTSVGEQVSESSLVAALLHLAKRILMQDRKFACADALLAAYISSYKQNRSNPPARKRFQCVSAKLCNSTTTLTFSSREARPCTGRYILRV